MVEAARNVRFCGSRQYTTLFARWYYAREDFAALILRPLCVSIAFDSRFLYDQADQHALKVRPRCACCVHCTTWVSSHASDTLMALCSIKVPQIARFLHSSTGYQMSRVLGHAAAIQIAILQEDLLFEIEEAERRRLRPKIFWVRAWLTDERGLRELKLEDTNSFFNYHRVEPRLFNELLHRVSIAQIGPL